MLLTRLPLTPKDAFDLHVLSLPPAFALSQDQTLNLESDLTQDLTELTEPHQRAGVSTSPSELSRPQGRCLHPPERPHFKTWIPLSSSNGCPKAARRDNAVHASLPIQLVKEQKTLLPESSSSHGKQTFFPTEVGRRGPAFPRKRLTPNRVSGGVDGGLIGRVPLGCQHGS